MVKVAIMFKAQENVRGRRYAAPKLTAGSAVFVGVGGNNKPVTLISISKCTVDTLWVRLI